MLELVDNYDLGSYAKKRESSSLSTRTKVISIDLFGFREVVRDG